MVIYGKKIKMGDRQILQVVEKVVGKGIKTNKGNYSFFSPFVQHRKRKLEIQLNRSLKSFGYWHCWVSNESGKNLFTLLKKVNASGDIFSELADILKETNYRKYLSGNIEEEHKTIKLPIEFIPLWIKKTDPEYKNAFHYCIKRGLTFGDIMKYNIGYCDHGRYRGFVIIPSYDSTGKLNYFVSRNYYDGEPKHKNPAIDKTEIIGFELFINWNLPIVLVEGAWDAIAVRDNVIPLYGKTISQKLKKTIIEKKVKDIYLILDNDALNDSIKISKYFMSNGINVYLVKLENNKDPNELGYLTIVKLKRETDKLSSYDLMKYRLS